MISVCLASYNGEKYIREQINSILSQLGPSDELIISDDSSIDKTFDIVTSFNDNRIQWVRSTCGNPSYNFANALSHAKGDYIFLSDQDDIWMPNKVKIICDYLSHYDLVVHDAFVVDSEGREILDGGLHLNPQSGFLKNLIKNTMFTGCCMAFKKKILLELFPFPNKMVLHDWWIGELVIYLGYKYTYTSDQLIRYRRHGQNVSSLRKSNNSIIKKIALRIYLLLGIIINRLSKKKKVCRKKNKKDSDCQ